MSKPPLKSFSNIARISSIIVLVFAVVFQTFQVSDVSAAQISSRSVTLGSSLFDATTTYAFNFTVPSSTVLQSASFTACTTASGTCTTPTGFVNSSSTLTAQPTNLGDASGWTVNTATAGSLRLSKSGNVAAPTGAQTVSFSSVANPDAINTTFFIRITTYSDAAWATPVDTGTVTASTARAIALDGTMPESLIFCTAATISTTSSVPDCTTATVGAVTFNQLFSPATTASATSQMAASTNAGSGYAITVNGATLTSGGNTITALSSPTASTLGISQFGMNLAVNTTPAVGTAVTPAANATNFKGRPFPTGGYETANSFKFVSGNTVADSADGGAGGTDAQIFTVSYIANVPGSQPAGTYTTTLTYICTPTF